MSSKRKAPDDTAETPYKSVVITNNVSSYSTEPSLSSSTSFSFAAASLSSSPKCVMEEKMLQLQQLQNKFQNNNDDPFLAGLEQYANMLLVHDEQELQDVANDMKLKLQDHIQNAKAVCQAENDFISQLQSNVNDLNAQKDAIINNLDKLDEQQKELLRQIAAHQEEASQEMETIDQVEEERKRLVPRLKTQISLYASTSNIKWDFRDDQLLAGQVTATSTGGIIEFLIDPTERTPFDVANQLWRLMEGEVLT